MPDPIDTAVLAKLIDLIARLDAQACRIEATRAKLPEQLTFAFDKEGERQRHLNRQLISDTLSTVAHEAAAEAVRLHAATVPVPRRFPSVEIIIVIVTVSLVALALHFGNGGAS